MVFSGLTFLFLFLPAVLLVYFAMPKRGKNAVLFAMSLVFYAWGEPLFMVAVVLSVLADYFIARRLAASEGRKRKGRTASAAHSATNPINTLFFLHPIWNSRHDFGRPP